MGARKRKHQRELARLTAQVDSLRARLEECEAREREEAARQAREDFLGDLAFDAAREDRVFGRGR